MDYPLLLGGKQAGTLSESRSGLYTVFEASLPSDPGHLVRLYLHGGGESAYLGLLQPWSGGLFLRRRLSALERRAFPSQIAFASDSPGPAESAPAAPPAELSDPPADHPAGAQSSSQSGSLHNNKQARQSDLRSCPWPAPVPEGDGKLLWMKCTDGTLRAFDGVSTLVAFPTTISKPKPGMVLRRIGGKDYLVFRR